MKMAANDPGIVIIGAGEAGTRAALTLREEGYEGEVTLIGAENNPPYERPPLSKTGPGDSQTVQPKLIISRDALAQQGINYRSGLSAAGIERTTRQVRLSNGEALAYSRLLLATGAVPRRLALPGADLVPLHYLRDVNDRRALCPYLRAGNRLVIIGGGFIGLEVAALAHEQGAMVTVIEVAQRILTRAVPALIAARIAARHREAGITLLEGVALSAIRPTGSGAATVHLADGRIVEAEAIIVGIGAKPDTALAEASGLAIENGICVDASLTTSDPMIFAAGDCCSFPHPVFGGRRLRLEAWRNAHDQGLHVARTMLGERKDYAAIPWFWSDQFAETLQIAGLPDEADETILRDGGDTPFLFHLKAGRLVGASAFGPLAQVARDMRLAERLIAAEVSPDPVKLADAAIKMKSLLPVMVA